MDFGRFFLISVSCLILAITPVMAATTNDNSSISVADSPLPRNYHISLVFDNKMWVIGGADRDNIQKSDVWYSSDGVNWICANRSAGFSNIGDKRAVVYNNRIWLIVDPFDKNKSKNEIWSSADGIFWNLETESPDFSERDGFGLLNFDNRIWVIAGGRGTYLKDVWYSTNGINWTCANASSAFPGRDSHAAFIYDDKMWIVGGMIGNCAQLSSDVWYSSDGIIWNQATSGGSYGKSDFFTSLVYDNRIWIFKEDQVWQSRDGSEWTHITTNPDWYHQFSLSQNKVVYGNKMWVISGDRHGLGDDVWYSNDGRIWTRADTKQRIWPRTQHSAIVFNDRIWLIGGKTQRNISLVNDVWNTQDGVQWSRASVSALFTPGQDHSSVVFNDTIWVIGGTPNGTWKGNEIWRSTDGNTWEKVNVSKINHAWKKHTSVVFDKKIWIIAESVGNIWNSPDGVTWNLMNQPFKQNTGGSQGAVVFKDRLWIIGGLYLTEGWREYSQYQSWFTTDGVNWTCTNASLPFEIRFPQSLINYKNRMWVINGHNGVWSSADGYIWEHTGDLPATPNNRNPVILVYHDKIWAIGGDPQEYRNDAWYSEDGKTWKRIPENSAEIPLEVFSNNPLTGWPFSIIRDGISLMDFKQLFKQPSPEKDSIKDSVNESRSDDTTSSTPC
jgi:hypothetical protein